MPQPSDRLDSWKAIAEYLGRDTRTLRRWEKLGLPVRRVAGSRGHSVFAFRSEIDVWLKAHVAPPQEPTGAPARVDAGRRPAPRRWRFAIAAMVVVIGIVGWKAMAPAARQPITVSVSTEGAVAHDARGVEQWRYEFGSDVRNALPADGPNATVVNGPDPAVFVRASLFNRRSDDVTLNGRFLRFSMDGRLEQSFSFDDHWDFAGRTYGQPWAMTDFRVYDAFGRRRIALAAHHATWWPSMVTLLDDRLGREGTFVNSGWIGSVRWLSPDRLAISGFNQRLDGGMVAVLDTHNLDGASPEPPGSPFRCDDCRGALPLAYVVLPRSEVNRVTGSAFNRATIDVTADGITAHTFEMDPNEQAGVTEAIYEFSPELELRSASYGSRYWDRHRALELQGAIAHTRENCPEKNGPPFIWMWTRDAGWAKVTPKR